jgi:hypothetical protein
VEAVDGGEGEERVCELRREVNGSYRAVKEVKGLECGEGFEGIVGERNGG